MAPGETAEQTRLGPKHWGPKDVLFGVLFALAGAIFTFALLIFAMALTDAGNPTDVGDVFVASREIAEWSIERLEAARAGEPLPGPPQIYADLTAVRLTFVNTFLYQAILIMAAGVLTRSDGVRDLMRSFGMRRYSPWELWRPGLAVLAAYFGIVAYSVIVTQLDIDILEPESTIPSAVTRDELTLVMTGVLAIVAAPLAEEIFFRGFVFTGLLKWGFWPAAAVSSILFTIGHLDPGSMIPFFGIGILLAWLYWRSGTLWDAIAFHTMFNTLSFLLLLATEG